VARVALRGSYVEFVIFMGTTENYPRWFEKLIEDAIYVDESRFTFYVDRLERRPDYYEKSLIEDYSVFIRKSDGEVHVTNYDTFQELYISFKYNDFKHAGLAALEEDCIEYVECKPGVLSAGYPDWFYEYFTEMINFPHDEETIYLYDETQHCLTAKRGNLIVPLGGDATVTKHCVFLHNRFGEVRGMDYDDFIKYYDPNPKR
jgi:hypothetical protein